MRKHKYYLVYKTVNLLTGHYYLGMHTCNDLDDGYLGSGLRLKRAIKKYGKHNFKRRIVKFCSSREQMCWWERKYVSLHLGKEKCYNIAEGGQGGWEAIRKNPEYENKRKLRAADPESIRKRTESFRSNPEALARVREANRRAWLGKNHSSQSRDKMSISQRERWTKYPAPHAGKCWITHDQAQLTMRVPRSEVDDYFAKGWRAGRVMRYQHVRDYLLELP